MDHTAISLPRAPSPTWVPDDAKIAPAGESRRKHSRRQAAPYPGATQYGPHTPVRVQLTYRGGSEGWLEVSASTGKFYVAGDVSVIELVQQLIAGGHLVRGEPGPSPDRKRRRGKGASNP